MSKIEALPFMVPERRTNIRIDSHSFVPYLIGELRDQPRRNFDSRLELPIYTPALRAIANEANIVSKDFQEEVKEDGEDPVRTLHPIFDLLSSDHDTQKAERRKRKKGQGEVGSIVYFDNHYGRHFYTPPVKGTYSQTLFNYHLISEAFNNGIVSPVLEVHNHPDDSLYSAIDFTRMMKRKSAYQRVVRGSVLLLPSMQVLAVATDKTPIFNTWEEVQVKVEELNTTSSKLRNIDDLPSYHEYLDHAKQTEDELAESLPSITPALDKLLQMKEKYGLTIESIRDAMRSLLSHYSPRLYTLIEEDEELYSTFSIDRDKQYHNSLLKRAQNLELVLYSSQDMKHFTEFTA